MNEELEPFEQRLARQPIRRIPAEWRKEILAAAISHQSSPARNRSFLSTLNSQLSTILWPHPVAWAGLAAVWLFILGVDFSSRDRTSAVVENGSTPPAEVIVEVRQQQRLLVELLGARDARDVDRSKPWAPQPRSERMEILNA